MIKNKYEEIITYFKKEFVAGRIKVGDQIMTEKEISEKFSVSRITSKRAIDDLVNEGLIERIRGKGSFYLGEKKSKSQRASESKIIAMLFDIPFSFGMDYIKGCSIYLNQKGYILTPYFFGDNPNEEALLIDKLKKKEIAGLIVYPHGRGEQFELFLECDYFNFDSVVSDNFSGGYKIAEALIKKGHKKVAQIYGELPSTVSSVIDRMKGNLSAFEKNNLKIESENVFYKMKIGNNQTPESKKELNDFLEKISKTCTAIICENDVIAKDIISMGIIKNKKIEVTGFDNLKKSGLMDVTWMTVEQNFEKIGRNAGRLILKRIENPTAEIVEKKIEVKLLNV